MTRLAKQIANLIGLLIIMLAVGSSMIIVPSTHAQSGNTPYFWEPVDGIGDGVSIGSYGPGWGNHSCGSPDQYAIDYIADSQQEGITVWPALAGRVVYAGYDSVYGYVVAIRTWDDQRWDRKYYSIYAHLTGTDLPQVGDLVDGSQPIGYMGKTGSGSNDVVHLHFAVRYSDSVYDGTKALFGQSLYPTRVVYTPAFNIRSIFGYDSSGC